MTERIRRRLAGERPQPPHEFTDAERARAAETRGTRKGSCDSTILRKLPTVATDEAGAMMAAMVLMCECGWALQRTPVQPDDDDAADSTASQVVTAPVYTLSCRNRACVRFGVVYAAPRFSAVRLVRPGVEEPAPRNVPTVATGSKTGRENRTHAEIVLSRAEEMRARMAREEPLSTEANRERCRAAWEKRRNGRNEFGPGMAPGEIPGQGSGAQHETPGPCSTVASV